MDFLPKILDKKMEHRRILFFYNGETKNGEAVFRKCEKITRKERSIICFFQLTFGCTGICNENG
jgi:hypothetical protein